MTHKNYTVLIPVAGRGQPIGDITNYTNKALVKVGKKPAISYIIEAYPKSTEFVITTGYFGGHIKDFLKLVYPDRKFIFVEVDRYEGRGSSLVHSMLQAKNYLKRPFIYHAGDTIILNPIPLPEDNWIGGYKGEGSSHYAGFNIQGGKVQKIYEKGMITPDYLHIGLVGIKDHASFWKRAKELDVNARDINDTHILNHMIESGIDFKAHQFSDWHDTGNVDSLNRARKSIPDSFHILDKLGESIFLFDTFVIKFFHDESMVRDRIARAKVLSGLVPTIEASAKNFYRYQYAKGNLLADVASPSNFAHFLQWSKKNLWKSVKDVSNKDFKRVCYDFYYTKSIKRINAFLESQGIEDKETVINGVKVPAIHSILKKIDFDWLSNGTQTNFHGDFILDNIIKTKDGYILLDWRQNFGGLIRSGDMYYDLAKLNHNLTLNHAIISDNLFTITMRDNQITCDILRKNTHVECQDIFFDFLKEYGYDTKKVQVLTALSWINMSPLHHHPYDLFLFYFGKLNLWRALHDTKKT